jgi:phage FluMu gp28-like protein
MLASNPAVESIRGKKFNIIIMDEFALYPEKVVDEIILPTQATFPMHRVKTIFTSTPRGRGQFYTYFQRGLDDNNPNWKSYNLPSWTSPFVNQNYIDEQQAYVPEKVFQQEYGAQFIDDAGILFANIDKAAKPYAEKSGQLYAGIDLGFTEDYCVVWICNGEGKVVFTDRFNQIGMTEAVDRIYDALKQHNWPITYIENNMYQGVFEMLQQKQCKNIKHFNTNSASKKTMIERLMVRFEEQTLTIPENEYIQSEFISYEYTFNPKTRNVSYAARSGQHDDYVMACAMAIQAVETQHPLKIFWSK